MRDIGLFDFLSYPHNYQQVGGVGRADCRYQASALVLGLLLKGGHPRYVTVTLSTFAHQQQAATLDGPVEIGNRHFVAALPAPDVGQQALADFSVDGLPALAGGAGEVRE